MNDNLSEKLKKYDGTLISNHANISYLLGDFGFSISERECFILLTKNKKFVITDKRYSEAVEKKVKNFEIIDSGVGLFFKKTSKDLFEKYKIKKIGFEENNLTFSEHKALGKFAKFYPIDLSDLRIIKRPDEIKNVRLACSIGNKAFKYTLKQIKSGVTEIQIASKLEEFIKNKNADISFKPIVAFGKNSSIPHHMSDKTKLDKNQIVLLDFGVRVDNYCSDMSRTLYFGKAPNKFKKMHKTVLLAQTKAIDYIKVFYSSSEPELVEGESRSSGRDSSQLRSNNKLLAKNIDKVARDYIIEQGFPNIPHSLGHGIGIEVHEPPSISPGSKVKIKEGMIFSVEPGIYLKNFGGVRIEDLVLVKKGGIKLLTGSKRELFEL